MNEITTTNRAALSHRSGEEVTAEAMLDFVKWVDRGERTTAAYIKNLRQFAAWLSFSGITSPTRDDIAAYRDYLGKPHRAISLTPAGWIYRTTAAGDPIEITCKPSTVAQYIRIVRQFFTWAYNSGRISRNIAEGIRAPKVSNEHKKEALKVEDVAQIESSIKAGALARGEAITEELKDAAGRIQRNTEQGKRLFAMFMLTVNAGLRTIELARANVGDLEEKRGGAWLYIWGKGRSEADQKKAIAPEVLEALRDYLKTRKDKPTKASPLFVATGNRSGGRRLASTTISTMLKRALVSAGFDSERITAHSLRHTTGTTVQTMTGNIYATQTYMRHANPATTEIYLHIDQSEKEAETAQALYNLFHGIKEDDPRSMIERSLQTMSAEKLRQLAGIVSAMA